MTVAAGVVITSTGKVGQKMAEHCGSSNTGTVTNHQPGVGGVDQAARLAHRIPRPPNTEQRGYHRTARSVPRPGSPGGTTTRAGNCVAGDLRRISQGYRHVTHLQPRGRRLGAVWPATTPVQRLTSAPIQYRKRRRPPPTRHMAQNLPARSSCTGATQAARWPGRRARKAFSRLSLAGWASSLGAFGPPDLASRLA